MRHLLPYIIDIKTFNLILFFPFKVCKNRLGTQSGGIKDVQIYPNTQETAREIGICYTDSLFRLFNESHYIYAHSSNTWDTGGGYVQVELNEVYTITGVMIQGKVTVHFVNFMLTSLKL